ncbi:GGDEF domain-containing response regulator [Alteromonas lipolytica]|uniref:GGDEF domain-containing response regulator n=1 Tax=Alteromonas lipolytica TaxID=1856405 RepID=UPI000AE5EDB8|nr:diguanylate cyclase [Alteromonas lipolytica]GGF62739.1 diguanylate cyclase response regulator [Alteromonas lipolytica]
MNFKTECENPLTTIQSKISFSDPLNVLVVDDSATERALLSAILERFGVKVIEAEGADSALQCLQTPKLNIDLILMDIQMPDISGYQLAAQIRKMESESFLEWHPIIFLSGQHDPQSIAMGIECGADDYLTKPVDSITLLAKMRAMTRIAEMRRRLVKTQETLSRQAHFDELTGIANRRHIFNLLENEISRCRRYNYAMSIAYFDIDFFKRINDNFGHNAGDKVLQRICSVVEMELRKVDMLGRIGGEEFCIILPECQLQNASGIIDRLRESIANINFDTDILNRNVTASFGVTHLRKNDNLSNLISRADELLYEAKNGGRNCVVSRE